MLANLKAKTPCKDCGRKGHWRGDKECTMQRNKPYERKAHVATRFCDAYSTSRCASGSTSRFFDVGDCGDADKCGYMNVQQDTLPVPGESAPMASSSVAVADSGCSSCTHPQVEIVHQDGYLMLAPPSWPAQAHPKGIAKARPPGLEEQPKSSSSSISLATTDAELIAVQAAIEEALTESLRLCQSRGRRPCC